MTVAVPTAHVVAERIVFTYQPACWPVGVLTGYDDGAGGFALEHVICFPWAPPSTLVRMLRAGLTEAWARDFQYVTFHVPHGFPLGPALVKLGQRLGFTQYEEHEAARYFVRHRP